jgi:uncharacterized integral membrane protein (TIGR00697 family)
MSTSSAARPAAPLTVSLFAFSVFYGGMVCIAGVLGNKQAALGPLAVEAGIFAFLLLVVTSSAVAELHGQASANRLVVLGFVPLLVSLGLTLMVLAVPPAAKMEPERLGRVRDDHERDAAHLARRHRRLRVSQLLNVTIFTRLKGAGGRLLWLRSGVAGVLSQIVDTLLFITIAFYGVFPIGELLLGQMLAKVTLSALLVPPLIYLFVGLGRRLDART